MTDGQSNYPQQTVLAALRTHNANINVFAVGVGASIAVSELQVIASDPVCLYVILLSTFTELDSLKYIIQKRTCDGGYI